MPRLTHHEKYLTPWTWYVFPWITLTIVCAAPIDSARRSVVDDLNNLINLVAPALSSNANVNTNVKVDSSGNTNSNANSVGKTQESIRFVPFVGPFGTRLVPVAVRPQIVQAQSGRQISNSGQKSQIQSPKSQSQTSSQSQNSQNQNTNSNVAVSQNQNSQSQSQSQSQVQAQSQSTSTDSDGIAVLPIKAGDVSGIIIIPMPKGSLAPTTNTQATVPIDTNVQVTDSSAADTPTSTTPNNFSGPSGQHSINKTPLGAGFLGAGVADALNATAVNPVPDSS